MDNLLKLAQQFVQGVFGKVSQSPVHAQAYTAPVTSSQPTPIATPTPSPVAPTASNGLSPEQVQQGFLKYAPNTPLATQSGVISQALSSLSPKIDPRLILGLALKETRGGMDLTSPNRANNGVNNNWNVMPGGHLVNYPDLKTALLGGDNPIENHPSRGLINVLNNDPAYAKYRQTGNLADFFSAYSPPGQGNAPLPQQIQQAMEYMKYWQ